MWLTMVALIWKTLSPIHKNLQIKLPLRMMQ